MWHPEDNLLDGITFQELIDTIVSNEYSKKYGTIYRVFNDLLELKVEAAREAFTAYYDNIKEELYEE